MIETEHNDYKIRYSENEDVWRCYDLDLEAATLSALKAKINKYDADKRRLPSVPVLIFHNYSGEVTPAVATLIDGDKVWVSKPRRRGSGKEREKLNLKSVLIDTPENRALLGKMQALYKEEARIAKERRELVDSFPTPTLDDFKAIANNKMEEE